MPEQCYILFSLSCCLMLLEICLGNRQWIWANILSASNWSPSFRATKHPCCNPPWPCTRSDSDWTSHLFITMGNGAYDRKLGPGSTPAIECICKPLATGLLRSQINALKAMIPELDPLPPAMPRGSRDIGDGFILLRAKDKALRAMPVGTVKGKHLQTT